MKYARDNRQQGPLGISNWHSAFSAEPEASYPAGAVQYSVLCELMAMIMSLMNKPFKPDEILLRLHKE